MPEDMPDRMPEDMPDRMPEDMSDRMPGDLPVTKCINVMAGITRSKVIFWASPSPFPPQTPTQGARSMLVGGSLSQCDGILIQQMQPSLNHALRPACQY